MLTSTGEEAGRCGQWAHCTDDLTESQAMLYVQAHCGEQEAGLDALSSQPILCQGWV